MTELRLAFRTPDATAKFLIVITAGDATGTGVGEGDGAATGAAKMLTVPTLTQVEIFCHSSVDCAWMVYSPGVIEQGMLISFDQNPSTFVPERK